jgi:hypothetical protein
METAEQQPDLQSEKTTQIKSWIDRQVDIPYQDAQWLLDEIARIQKEQEEQKVTQEKERKVLKLLIEFENRARHVLTLWLAFRGSMDEETFKATQQLGQQTVGVLNGKS